MSDGDEHNSAVEQQGAIDNRQNAPVTKTEQEERKAAAEFVRSEGGNGKIMRVKVYSPFRSYYDGQALSVSAINATGPFDVLPRHHNFISLLNPCDLMVRTAEGVKKIIISGGVMHVKADQVIVFLDV